MMLWLMVASAQVSMERTQLVAGWASDVDASHATVQRFQRTDGAWEPVGASVPARLGIHGLAWGSGLHPPQQGRAKHEGDGRSPMGIFELGQAFADMSLVLDGGWPMLQTTVRDLWVEDPAHAAYNTHVRVPGDRPLTDWEVSQRMRLGDEAHALKVAVRHNHRPAVAGAGSAIFLHIWRQQGARPTSGCTALPVGELKTLLDWLEPASKPVYVLLTRADWERHGEAWGLPALPASERDHTATSDPHRSAP